jgi:hypothetical protein
MALNGKQKAVQLVLNRRGYKAVTGLTGISELVNSEIPS